MREHDRWSAHVHQQRLDRIKADHGGAVPTEYDEAGGVFPDQLSDLSEILNAPAYAIDGVTRKGGFIDNAPSRLDTTKIEELKK